MSESRLLAVLALSIFSIATSGCRPAEESSSPSPGELAANQGTRAEQASVDETPQSRWPETATVEELLTPQAVRASLQDRFGDECEIRVHEIAAVDRAGERSGTRVYGEAVVEIAFADRRLLTIVVLMQYGDSAPIVWQDWIDICATRHRDVPVTNEPTPEALAFFQSACRSVRAMTMAGAVEEPTTFRYGYVDPKVDRVWKGMLERADSSEP